MRPVLMVAYYFPPAGGAGVQRTLKFARYLPRYGWRPHVLVPDDPDEPRVLYGRPTTVVVASPEPERSRLIQGLLSGDNLRLYTNRDPVGVQAEVRHDLISRLMSWTRRTAARAMFSSVIGRMP